MTLRWWIDQRWYPDEPLFKKRDTYWPLVMERWLSKNELLPTWITTTTQNTAHSLASNLSWSTSCDFQDPLFRQIGEHADRNLSLLTQQYPNSDQTMLQCTAINLAWEQLYPRQNLSVKLYTDIITKPTDEPVSALETLKKKQAFCLQRSAYAAYRLQNRWNNVQLCLDILPTSSGSKEAHAFIKLEDGCFFDVMNPVHIQQEDGTLQFYSISVVPSSQLHTMLTQTHIAVPT